MSRSRRRLEEGWACLLLLSLMLLSVVWSVRAAEWTEGLGILQWIAMAGILLGLFLAKWRRVPGFVAHSLSVLTGVACVTLMLSISFRPPRVPRELVGSVPGLWAKASIMYKHVFRWFADPSGTDVWLSNFAFMAVLTIVTWLLAYLSTWFVFRLHWVWGAVVPAGAGCLLNTYYAPPRVVVYFVAFCLCALLLVVRTHVYIRQRSWQRAAVKYNMDVDLTFLRDGMLVSLLALSVAWTIPAAARSPRLARVWEGFQEPWHRVQTQWNRLFTSLNYEGQSRWVNFGPTMTLGGGVSLSNVPVLEVRAGQPRYWGAVAYDKYTGSGWVNTDDTELALQENDFRLAPKVYVMQQEFAHTICMLESGEATLFHAGQPVRISVPALARLTHLPVRVGQRATDVSMVHARRGLRRNQCYTVVSLVSIAQAGQLRTAGTDYPDWVKERYLQLPPGLSERVRLLAGEIVRAASTGYDQAVALESYLRRIPYDRHIQAPRAGHDAVDWFLFENRRGYCDYYASAMAVMCRAVGIPARVWQGYATGEYAPDKDSYQVRQLDAHTWPEVFFPDYGWIRFEPTASQPLIARPEDDQSPPLPGLALGLGEVRTGAEEKFGPDEGFVAGEDIGDITLVQSTPWHTRAFHLALALIATLTGVLLALLGVWHFTLRGLGVASRIYEEMCRLGALLGVAREAHQTPIEYAESLAGSLVQGQLDARRVAALYVRQRFSANELSEGQKTEAQESWRRLRWPMCRQLLRARLPRRRSRTSSWVPASSMRPAAPLE